MNKLKSTDTGGFPFNLDDLRWFLGQSASDAGIYQVLNSMLRALGDNFIVYGCELGGLGVLEGLIMLDGELLWVDEHAKTGQDFEKITTYDAAGLKTFQDTSSNDTYEKNRATVTAIGGALPFTGADRLDTATTSFKAFVELATNTETITGTDSERAVTPASLQAKVSSTTAKGIVELATSTETKAGTDYVRAVSPAGLLAKTPMSTKIVDIGDWDMNVSVGGTTSLNVAHGLTLSSIRSIKVMVRNDTDNLYFELGYPKNSGGAFTGTPSGYVNDIGATNVLLKTISGGGFDTTSFDATSYNRGYIVIDYVV